MVLYCHVLLLATVEPGGSMRASKVRRLLKDKSLMQYGDYCTSAVARTAVRDTQVLAQAMGNYGIKG